MYNDILKHWLEQGHFSINSIDTISVYVDRETTFDGKTADIVAKFVSNGEIYICGLSGISGVDGFPYKILDIQRQ